MKRCCMMCGNYGLNGICLNGDKCAIGAPTLERPDGMCNFELFEIRKGTILGFEGSWLSGLASLVVKDAETGEVERLSCENTGTARALDAAFGDVIQEGHMVEAPQKEIYWMAGEYVDLGSFMPVEFLEAEDAELFERYEEQAKIRKGGL